MTSSTAKKLHSVRGGNPLSPGEFSPDIHSDDVALLTAVPDIDSSDEPPAVPLTVSGLSPQQVLEQAQKSTRMLTEHNFFKNGMDQDDLVAQSALKAWQQIEKNRAQGVTIANEKAYIHRIASSVVSDAVRGTDRAENIRARKLLKNELEKLAHETGQMPTAEQKRQVQDRIIAEWHDPRHKPTADWDKNYGPHEISLEALEDATGGNFAVVRSSSQSDYAEDSVDGKVSKRDAWDNLAELKDLPLVEKKSLTWRRSKEVRGALTGDTAVVEAARAWNNGVSNEATEALFSPFGRTSDTDRDRIADAMVDHEGYANEIWQSAVSAASVRAK